MSLKKRLVAAAAVGLLSVAGQAQAAKHTICVWDIVGQHGDLFNMMKDYSIAARGWGAEIVLKPYTDEKIASEDFKAGQCDGVVMTGMRTRLFNSYAGSIDSLGSLPTYEHLKLTIQAMANPKLADKMKSGPYEVAGIAPMGAAYLFVNDKKINNVGALSGKKIAVLAHDEAQSKMVQKVGASPVMSDVTNFAGKFNNRSVDIIGAPAAAYKPLELYKGLSPNGGIVDYPLVQLTFQMIIRADKFPEPGFAQKSRDWYYAQYDRAMALVNRATKEIDPKFWMQIPAADKAKYDEMMRQSRIALRDDGIYNKETLNLLLKVRCKLDASRGECTEKIE